MKKNIRKAQKNKIVDIIAVLDKSGSMSNIQEEMVQAFNMFIKEQRKLEGNARLTLITFNQNVTVPINLVDLDEVPELEYHDVAPGGSTALNDAIGMAFAKGEGAENVVMLIQTDGQENCSQIYNTRTIRRLVTEKEEMGWDISFIGADIDAFADGNMYGFSQDKCFGFNKNQQGMNNFSTYVGQTVTTYRNSVNQK
jgi:Mg-chelatase subunit ChlD